MDPEAKRQRRANETPDSWPLTARELEILRLVANGWTNRRIAHELVISERTVKFHLGNVYRKLGVSSRTEAALVAIRWGWIDG